MLLRWALILLLLVGTGAASPARAGVISLSVSVKAQAAQGDLLVEVKLANQGTEPARDLSLQVLAAGAATTLAGPAMLYPAQPLSLTTRLPLALSLPGAYPVVARISFHDTNQYPFTTLAYGLFSHGPPRPDLVQAQGRPGLVAGSGQVDFVLSNQAETELPVVLTLHGPGELDLAQERMPLRLPARGSHTVQLKLRNRGALTGASYPILGVVEYIHEGHHYAAVASALARVQVASDPLHSWRPLLWGGLGFLLVMILLLELARLAKKRRRP